MNASIGAPGWATLLLATLSGCAAPIYGGRYPWNEGWREAIVVDASVNGPADAGVDCREHLSPELVSSRRFARVGFNRGRSSRSMIVLVPEGGLLRTGDRVYVDSRDCAMEIVLESAAT